MNSIFPDGDQLNYLLGKYYYSQMFNEEDFIFIKTYKFYFYN